MATRDRVIHVTTDSYDWLLEEATRRGVAPDELAEIRSRIRGGPDDAVAIVREGREELERRGL